MKSTYQKWIVALVLIGYALFFYFDKMNLFPNYIHAWTQSDRYAIALGYERNNIDVFHPESYFVNIDKTHLPYKYAGRTGVDFPIPEVFVAIFMKLLGTDAPWIFRALSLIVSLIGLYLFFKCLKLLSNSWIFGLGITLFIFSSPVVTYYSNGFIPSLYSFALFLIGVYYYTGYHKGTKNPKSFSQWILFLVFFTLATLIRTPYILLMFSFLFYELILLLKEKRFHIKYLFSVFISLSVIIGYQIYNYYYTQQFGSFFIRALQSASNLEEIKYCLGVAWQHWHYHYFTEFHYYNLLIILVFVLVLVMIKKTTLISKYGAILLIHTPIALLYTYLMIKQLPDHDYYFYDTLLPLIIIGFLFLAQIFNNTSPRLKPIFIFLLWAWIPFQINANYYIQKGRNEVGTNFRLEHSIYAFQDGDKLLKQHNIPDTAFITILDGITYNIPQILLKHKGINLNATRPEYIAHILTLPCDYFAVQNQYFYSDLMSVYPDIAKKVRFVFGNNRLSVLQKQLSDTPQTLEQLLGLSTKECLYTEKQIGTTLNPTYWTMNGVYKTDSCLLQTADYGLAFKFPIKKIKHPKQGILIYLKWKAYKTSTQSMASVAVSQKTSESKTFYNDFKLESQFTLVPFSNGWQEQYFVFAFHPSQIDDITLFLANYALQPIHIKDIEIRVYE